MIFFWEVQHGKLLSDTKLCGGEKKEVDVKNILALEDKCSRLGRNCVGFGTMNGKFFTFASGLSLGKLNGTCYEATSIYWDSRKPTFQFFHCLTLESFALLDCHVIIFLLKSWKYQAIYFSKPAVFWNFRFILLFRLFMGEFIGE